MQIAISVIVSAPEPLRSLCSRSQSIAAEEPCGIRGGKVIGATDEIGLRAIEDPLHIHDLHATILALMGRDHEQLTYRFQGRDFRLTDVAGKTDLATRLKA